MKSGQPKMRHLMSIAEARMPKAPAKNHAELVQQEQIRQAKQLVALKQQITELKAQALKVAAEAPKALWELRRWEQDWVNEVRTSITANRKRFTDAAKKEFEYAREDNPNATMPSVDLLECVTEGLIAWWDDKKNRLDWSDGQYRLNDYMDAHPRTEMSDDLSRLQSEDTMLRYIQYLNGGFGSVGEMDKTLDAISSYCSDLMRYSDNGWSGVGNTALDIVQKGIPVIILYCQLVMAIPN
jgi:hypothetical protein